MNDIVHYVIPLYYSIAALENCKILRMLKYKQNHTQFQMAFLIRLIIQNRQTIKLEKLLFQMTIKRIGQVNLTLTVYC